MGKQVVRTMADRAKDFADKLRPYLDTEGGKYSREMLNDFWRYWTEHNEGGKKMRYEMQKVFNIKRRLITWYQNSKQYERIPPTKNNPLSDDKLLSAIHRGLQGQPITGFDS